MSPCMSDHNKGYGWHISSAGPASIKDLALFIG
ncbi:hypothetical protein LSAT2_011567, partial [Lamellibrachia satsuma]